MRFWKLVLLTVVCTFLVTAGNLQGQTASSALVSGTVYDKSGAVVPNATVALTDLATTFSYTQTTNSAGQYLFPTVAPGSYKVSVTKEGFRSWSLAKFDVNLSKSYTIDATLELGQKSELVEVTAVVGAQLQTSDSTVGTVVGGDELKYLPTGDRGVTSLLTLQPVVAPMSAGIGTDNGGQVAGARSDQSTFLIDGGDATSDTEASGGYNTQFTGQIRPIVPVPVDSIEEFSVNTTNPNASFGRSQGGQVLMVTKRGTNDLHGTVSWYHQNDDFNANSWDNNASGIARKELKDNRYGGSIGGPLLKNRLFVFGLYEGRRFPQTFTFTRTVPSTALRSGIMTFHDCANGFDPVTFACLGGNNVQYNFNPANGPIASFCSSTGLATCEPQGRGASPVTLADMAQLPGQVTGVALGDGLNTVGYRANAANGIRQEFAVARVDYKINDRWNFFGSGRYQYYFQPGTQQIDIVGISGCSAPCSTRINPLQPRYYVAGLIGQITPRLLSETHVSWYRHWWEWATRPPLPQVSGTAAALSLAGEGTGATSSTKFADPYNIDTQNARSRVWNGKDTFASENLTYIKGRHTWQFGGSYRFENIYHQRTDKVTGGLALGPIFYLNAGSFFTVASTFRPPNCNGDPANGAIVSTNCIASSGDRSKWNNFYAALMGIPDRSAQLLARDGDLNPLPLGTPLRAQVHIHAVEGYSQDIWRVRPSLTLTLGLTYQVQKPPTEELGRQMVPIFADSGLPVDLTTLFQAREAAALNGQILNPDIAFSPVRHVAGNTYVVNHIDWNNVGPRLAFAWHPGSSLHGLGNGKLVLRGGWSVTHARMNGVGLVMTPLLGVGLGQIQGCRGPQAPPPIGNGTCSGGSTPANSFRLGFDGDGSNILPSAQPVQAASIPFAVSAPYGETRSFMIDPGFTLGYSHSFDLTVQRELPRNLLVEVGYVGRLGRDLVQNADMNATPFMFKDPTSGQSLGVAFDGLAQEVRAGGAITPEPWFENMAGAACAVNATCSGFSSVTAYLADQFNFEAGTGDLWSIMNTPGTGINILRFKNGQQPLDNIQVLVNNLTTHHGTSDYHAGFVSIHKRMSHGITFDANYTYSHSIDIFGINQENTQFSATSPFRPEWDRGPSVFDRHHVINFHWYHELPLGKGQRFGGNNAVVNKIIGGWHWAGIWTYASGFPLCVFGGFDYGTENPQINCNLPNSSFKNPGASRHIGVTGSNGVGTTGDMNLFANPETVSSMFRYPLISQDHRFGFGAIRGLPSWQVDLSVGKMTKVTERVAIGLTADFLNAFNHPIFNDPGTDATDLSTFGVINSTRNNPRFIQIGFRVEF
ncbi:MAG: hypothetical protein DMG35_18720 [Acidobacteria bacterium]|nr:MAG: hypothetical protein DMG35_18720 [Acidobacteriota bacterium]